MEPVPGVLSGFRCARQSNKHLEVHPERSRTMMKSMFSGLLFLLLCSSSVLGDKSVVVRDYEHVRHPLTWHGAREHCRTIRHRDLATITQSDVDHLLITEYFAWLGCYYPEFSNDCIWINQQFGNATSNHTCAVVNNLKTFYSTDCHHHFFFICQHSPEHLNYTLVLQSKTWMEALEYCRKNFHSLATLEDTAKLSAAVVQRDFPVWTGLHREGKKWKWSRGFSRYRNWASGEPKAGGDCATISSTTKKMSAQDCNARFPFVCLRDNIILIKESKTWEEALEHCRASNQELVSVQPGEDHRRVRGHVMEAQTDKVWTGLRFLAGDWLWMDGAAVQHPDLPLCPQPGRQCGALSRDTTGSVEGTDCLSRLNFLCYSSA